MSPCRTPDLFFLSLRAYLFEQPAMSAFETAGPESKIFRSSTDVLAMGKRVTKGYASAVVIDYENQRRKWAQYLGCGFQNLICFVGTTYLVAVDMNDGTAVGERHSASVPFQYVDINEPREKRERKFKDGGKG